MDANLEQADVETITRAWSVLDGAAVAVDPDAITFVARKNGVDVTWGVAGSGADHETLVDNGDGTGTWTVAAGDLTVGTWRWWALATVGASIRIPQRDEDDATSTGLEGTIDIRDR